MIHVGDRRRELPNIEGRQFLPPMPCRVIYVHPQRRYYTVEFIFDRDRFRESYFLPRSRAES